MAINSFKEIEHDDLNMYLASIVNCRPLNDSFGDPMISTYN